MLVIDTANHLEHVDTRDMASYNARERDMGKKRPQSVKTAKLGVNHVGKVFLEMGWIWREDVDEDYGIDGYVEPCIGESPTGKVMGVQVKTGDSYFLRETSTSFVYRVRGNDREYWRKHCLPIILVIVRLGEPIEAYYCNLSALESWGKKILIDKSKGRFDSKCKTKLHSAIVKHWRKLEGHYLNLMRLVYEDRNLLWKMSDKKKCRMKFIVVRSEHWTEIVAEVYDKRKWEYCGGCVLRGLPGNYFLKTRFPYFNLELKSREMKTFVPARFKSYSLASKENLLPKYGIVLSLVLTHRKMRKKTRYRYEITWYDVHLNNLGRKIMREVVMPERLYDRNFKYTFND